MPIHQSPRRIPAAHGPSAARFAAISLAFIALAALPARAGDALTLQRASVHAGGGSIAGGPWHAVIAIGQPEVLADGVAQAGSLELTGGVLVRALIRPDAVFGDDFED